MGNLYPDQPVGTNHCLGAGQGVVSNCIVCHLSVFTLFIFIIIFVYFISVTKVFLPKPMSFTFSDSPSPHAVCLCVCVCTRIYLVTGCG